MNKLSPKALGFSLGILGAVYVFLCGIASIFGWGIGLVDAISSLYIGYGPSILGSLIGALWGFIDGFVAGVVIAWCYNKFVK